MQFFSRYPLLILVATLMVSCDHKKDGKSPQVETYSPEISTFEDRQKLADEILVKSVLENDTVALRRVIFENPSMSLNRGLEDGDTLLTYALRKKFRQVRNILLEKGANPDLGTLFRDYAGFTPLMLASHLGDTNAITALLDARAQINLQDWVGDTALHKAIKNGYDDAARALIQAGTKLDIRNDRGEIPLETAQNLGRRSISDILLGLRSLEERAPSTEEFRRIIESGDTVNYRRLVELHRNVILDFEVMNPLVTAVESPKDIQSYEIAQSLLHLGFSPNGPEDAQHTPLGRAVALKKKFFVELLLRHRANTNERDAQGNPPLYYALENNDLTHVKLLMENGAQPRFGRFRACRVADQVQKRLTTLEEKAQNKEIQERLGCLWTR